MVAEKEAYFTNQTDFLVSVAVATDEYLTMFTDESIRWPLKPPYVKMFLADYEFMGYCVEISFEAIRQSMIQKGKINEKDPDSRFTAIMWLKVIFLLDEQTITL